jgi:peptide/nickel transport system ATP-binding protein
MDICRRENPALTTLAPGHRVACFAASPEVRPEAEASAAARPLVGTPA